MAKRPNKTISIHSSDTKSKLMIREWLIKELGGIEKLNVLELFGGAGLMYESLYTKCKKHMAFDLLHVDRPTWIRGDNRMLLATRAQGWDLYDLDAFSNPWLLANDICRLREDGVFGMAMTCCASRSFQCGGVIPYMRRVSGINQLDTSHNSLLYRWYFDVIEEVMRDWSKWGVTIKQAKYMHSQNARYTNYYAVVVEKKTVDVMSTPKLGKIVIKKAKA